MTYDLLCMGRITLDLFANELGVPFEQVKNFSAFVGGCPNNICVAAHRLGLKSTILTGVGDDLTGRFVRHFLAKEGIDTRHILTKPGFQTNTVMAAIQPPDDFQFAVFRADNADLELTISDVLAAPVTDTRALLFTGMGLMQEPSRSATQFAAETARHSGVLVVMDLDYRRPMWSDPRIYGITVRLTLPLVDIVFGTEHEVMAAAGLETIEDAARRLLDAVHQVVIVKRNKRGSTVFAKDGSVMDAPPFEVQAVNPLGAGDAYAAGFIYGALRGWAWAKCARFANACGAFIVTRHGCANDMPTLADVLGLMGDSRGFSLA